MRTIDGDLTDWTSADQLNALGTTAMDMNSIAT